MPHLGSVPRRHQVGTTDCERSRAGTDTPLVVTHPPSVKTIVYPVRLRAICRIQYQTVVSADEIENPFQTLRSLCDKKRSPYLYHIISGKTSRHHKPLNPGSQYGPTDLSRYVPVKIDIAMCAHPRAPVGCDYYIMSKIYKSLGQTIVVIACVAQ